MIALYGFNPGMLASVLLPLFAARLHGATLVLVNLARYAVGVTTHFCRELAAWVAA
jgi:hypothetical protein